ncbi:dolichyl-phosphate-mannose--protein mannosyltransferase [Trueperella sp. LYQ143]|uniref:dolichyl-phosphate-mannose--protein mannosyltransferase n=1 Tax=unclassified Trueperella TaxID=2630174 RepID=UPI0039837416
MSPTQPFLLGSGKRERYENELCARLGIAPRGVTLPYQVKLHGWLMTVLIGVIAALTRFIRLGSPHALVFDETYYVKGAYSLLHYGYERRWEGDNQNDLFIHGDLSALRHEPDYWVHPPFGKWLIAQGMRLFGDNNGYGWRCATALCGVLAVMLVVRIALRLFHAVFLAGCAGLFVALDGMGIVLSRCGLLDNLLAFFVLLGFWALLRDRESHLRQIAQRVAAGPVVVHHIPLPDGNHRRILQPAPRWGVPGGPRPWLLASGLFLGLSCAIKWSGIYALAVFGITVFVWGSAARRRTHHQLWLPVSVVREGVAAFFWFIPSACLAYLLGWLPWFINPHGWGRQWAHSQRLALEHVTHIGATHTPPLLDPLPISWAPDVVNSFIHYHIQTWQFHTTLTTPHTYQSQPWLWLIQGRPVSFFWRDETQLSASSCHWDHCVSAITSIGNPAIWWLGLVALGCVIWAALHRRDWRAWAILSGYGAMYLPWFLYSQRTIYQFYAVAILPFVALSLTFAIAVLTKSLPTRSHTLRDIEQIFFLPRRLVAPTPYSETGHRTAPLPTPTTIWLLSQPDLTSPTRGSRALRHKRATATSAGQHHPYPQWRTWRSLSRSARYLIALTLGLVIALSIFWLPLWWGIPIPWRFWHMHMWFPSWI